MAVFEARHITVYNKSEKLICSNFSFGISCGEIWMLLGPNGIGKSSFYEALIGIRKIAEGEIWLRDINITHISPNERVRLGLKYIAQQNALFDWLTILDNLKIIAQSLLSNEARKSAIDEAIQLFELEQFLYKTPAQLSGGQKRRVELSKILIGPAKIIIMDEPFAAIDDHRIAKLCEIFKGIAQKNGTAFLLNDHNQRLLMETADFSLDLNGMKITNLKQNNNKMD